MSELEPVPPALQTLYDGERRAPAGAAEECARIRARVLASVGVAAGVGAAASAADAASTAVPAGAAGAAGAAAIAGKIVVLAVAFGALGGGLYRQAASTSGARVVLAPPAVAPTPARVAAPAPVMPTPAPPPAAPSVSAAIAPAVALPRSARVAIAEAPPPLPPSRPAVIAYSPPPPPPVVPAVVPVVAPARGSAELPQHVLLARAWSALERGEAKLTLELVERDRAAHPGAALAEEREALHVAALRRLHRGAEARAGARSFVARYPDSIHRAFVDPALEDKP